jgi:hypothetical protein
VGDQKGIERQEESADQGGPGPEQAPDEHTEQRDQ